MGMYGLVSARTETGREVLAVAGKTMGNGATMAPVARCAAKGLDTLGSLVLRSWIQGILVRDKTRVLIVAVFEEMREMLKLMNRAAKRGAKAVRGTRSSGTPL